MTLIWWAKFTSIEPAIYNFSKLIIKKAILNRQMVSASSFEQYSEIGLQLGGLIKYWSGNGAEHWSGNGTEIGLMFGIRLVLWLPPFSSGCRQEPENKATLNCSYIRETHMRMYRSTMQLKRTIMNRRKLSGQSLVDSQGINHSMYVTVNDVCGFICACVCVCVCVWRGEGFSLVVYKN